MSNRKNMFVRAYNNCEKKIKCRFVFSQPIRIIDKIRYLCLKLFSLFGVGNKDDVDAYKALLKGKNVIKIIHFCACRTENAGDVLLIKALQKSIRKDFSHKVLFWNENVRQVITSAMVDYINNFDACLVGGGGLLLKDTNANDISGWQMPISKELIAEIKIPLIVLAIGYNRFRNQDEFEPVFFENIKSLVKKSSFFGARNMGSVRAIQNYLDDNLKDKVCFYPCATTILSNLSLISAASKKHKKKFIALNCAFDREDKRFGNNEEAILKSIAKVMQKLSGDFDIKCYVHCGADVKILPYLDDLKVKYEVISLIGEMSLDKFVMVYSMPSLVLGMRGHAQLIPFGCNTPICSIISHDKLKWFLDDIKHPEWGVDVNDKDFENKLYERAISILNDGDIQNKLHCAQTRLAETTRDALHKIELMIVKNKGKK